jgi:hypothetical protein
LVALWVKSGTVHFGRLQYQSGIERNVKLVAASASKFRWVCGRRERGRCSDERRIGISKYTEIL